MRKGNSMGNGPGPSMPVICGPLNLPDSHWWHR